MKQQKSPILQWYLGPRKHNIKSAKITLLGGEGERMGVLHQALSARGYRSRLLDDSDKVHSHLIKTDILLLDLAVANQPRSSSFIKVPTILVMSDNGAGRLPPWLEARHVFLLPYPDDPHELIERLTDYTVPQAPDLGIDPENIEHLALLFGITQSLSGHLDLDDLFDRILSLAPFLEAEFASLLVQEGDETLYYRSTQPGREELTGLIGRRFAERLLEKGVEGWVMRHNQAALLPNTIYDSRWFRASYLPDKAYCVLALPINLERVNARGVYLIGCNRGAGRSTNYDLSLLEAAVTQIGMAIENAILFKNQAERSIQLSLINEVSQAATSILNLDVMLRTVVKAIRRTFAFHNVAIHLYNPQTNWIELRAKATGSHYSHMAPPPPEEVITHRLRQGLIGWAVATNKTILANDVTKDPRYIFSPHDKEVRSELCIPIALSVKTIGVLDLQSTQLEAFDKYHVSALETLADQLAIAIENARLYEEINRRIEELKSLNEIGQAITSTLDLQKTLTLITAHTTRLMNTAAASVALLDEETCEVWFAAASGEGSQKVIGLRMPLGQGIAGWVAQQGEAVIIPDAYADPRFFAEVDQSSGFTTVSILCVPLQSRGRNIGAIEVMNKKGGEFDREDRSLLQALALSAATAIENAQLYEKQTRTINRLAETQNQLVQSAKLAAVGELAAGIAHEINNPLTTIIGLASLLLDTCDYETEDERLEDLQMVNEEARRARDIVRRLLNFARADTTLQRQPADLNQIIEEAIYLVYTKSVSQQIELEKSLAPLPKIPLDVNQVKQVIVNLLNNAVQAMLERPARRPAYLSVTTQLLPPSSPQATGEVVCQIKDTGPGIAPEYLHKIFDPFFTTKEVGQGTGLGLSISYSIVRNHGGQITVSSALGQETVFTVSLPLVIT